MSDEPIIETRGKGEARRTVITVSLWAALALAGIVVTHVRNSDLERLQAVDVAGQKRAEINAAAIAALKEQAEREARDNIARDQRALRVELSVAGSVDLVSELRTTVKELTHSIQRLNLELASMRAARGGP